MGLKYINLKLYLNQAPTKLGNFRNNLIKNKKQIQITKGQKRLKSKPQLIIWVQLPQCKFLKNPAFK